jgi:Saccharopine dehydrogenase NADP binding domain
VVGPNDPKGLSEALKDIACVVHMAGPFAVTSAPMLDACLATQTNYIDITGEIEVFEAIWSREDEIKRAGITVVPGAGFDVAPSDCLAGYVASKLEQPASLVIALRGLEGASQVRCAPPFAKFRNPYWPGGREQSLSSTTDRHAGSISALAMNHVFLSRGATLPLHFTVLA